MVAFRTSAIIKSKNWPWIYTHKRGYHGRILKKNEIYEKNDSVHKDTTDCIENFKQSLNFELVNYEKWWLINEAWLLNL